MITLDAERQRLEAILARLEQLQEELVVLGVELLELTEPAASIDDRGQCSMHFLDDRGA